MRTERKWIDTGAQPARALHTRTKSYTRASLADRALEDTAQPTRMLLVAIPTAPLRLPRSHRVLVLSRRGRGSAASLLQVCRKRLRAKTVRLSISGFRVRTHGCAARTGAMLAQRGKRHESIQERARARDAPALAQRYPFASVRR
jgi:hypothetical protein